MIRLGLAGAELRPLDADPGPEAATDAVPVGEKRAAPAPASTPVPWERVHEALGDQFEVEPAFAEGGMATLFPLRHRLHGGQLVAKVLHLQLADRPEIRAGFLREARHAATLGDHPSAIPIFDLQQRDDLLLMLMPFVPGIDLDRLLVSRGPLSRHDALTMTAQISSLLCHAEAHGITHGDLSPGNLRLDRFQRFRLMDFGLSHCTSDEEPYVHLGGTPLYNSPETLRGEQPDIRSDLYSLGVVLAEVLSGEQIFRAETLEAIRQKHLEGQWAVPASLEPDEAVRKLLLRLLALRREDRMQSAFELSGALAGLGFEMAELRPATRGEGTSKRRTRITED